MGLGGRPGSSLLMFLLRAKWEAGSCRGKGNTEEGLGLGERLSQGEDAGSRRTHLAPSLWWSTAREHVDYTESPPPDTEHFTGSSLPTHWSSPQPRREGTLSSQRGEAEAQGHAVTCPRPTS